MNHRLLALFLAAIFLFGMVGCGADKAPESSEPESSQDVSAANEAEEPEKAEEPAETEIPAEEPEEPERIDVVFGNKPNNLYQSSSAPCFGEGRIYYINRDNELASFALDGSDHLVHGSVGTVPDHTTPSGLNYYQNAVYFVVTVEEPEARYPEIRRFDLASNEVEPIASMIGNSEYNVTTANGLAIINDDLYYSYYEGSIANGRIVAGVISLTSDQTNTIKTISSPCGVHQFVFDSDGKYLYMRSNDMGTVYRLPLSHVYDEEPECEQVLFGTADNSLTFDDGGFYVVVAKEDHSISYGFYDYEKANAQWEYDLVMDTISDTAEDQEQLFLTNHYVLGQSMVCVSNAGSVLYSASADDLHLSDLVKLDFAYENGYGYVYWLGEYEDVLYVVSGTEDGEVLQAIAPDGSLR